ncbi:PD40 domain-containing protein [Oculatella sp. FACHB-28]|uniref:PD40 domain-containing protein n=1 Tax=Oculatella sp. FACHB-28 TaxID=2692845 RepID=UPI0016837ECD|nr:PD40 domain-containing protein [Oculatella sp. FACHB-28]MBD2054483.1 PD40 domain-containing protein [Oculatella sp. FACHB-28]
MKHSLLALISLLILPLVSSPLSSSLAATTDVETRQSTESLIAFVGYRYEEDEAKVGLFTVNSDGGDRHELTSTLDIPPNEGTITNPVWSPDGQRLAFVQLGFDGTYVVYAVNADGSSLAKLFSEDNCSPVSMPFNAFSSYRFNGVWSANSQNLVFEKTCSSDAPEIGDRTELYVSDTTRPETTRLIRRWIQSDVVVGIETNPQTRAIHYLSQPGPESNIAISSDGEQVVFSEDRITYRMKTDGSEVTPLPTIPDANVFTSYTTFIWSPDSVHIARVERYVGIDYQQVYVLNADGTILNQTRRPRSYSGSSPHFLWSPDNDRLAYYQHNSPNDPFAKGDIYSLNINGDVPKNITQQREYYREFLWLPSGEQIFSITDGPIVALINADGSGLVDITSQFPSNFFKAVWSSTGEQVALVSTERRSMNDAHRLSLYVTNQDGLGLMRLTDDRDLDVIHVVWQP